MSDVAVVKDVLPGPIEVRGNRKVVRSKVLILDADLLEEGAQYLISLGVVNSDGRSGAQLVVKIPSPPIQGKSVLFFSAMMHSYFLTILPRGNMHNKS